MRSATVVSRYLLGRGELAAASTTTSVKEGNQKTGMWLVRGLAGLVEGGLELRSYCTRREELPVYWTNLTRGLPQATRLIWSGRPPNWGTHLALGSARLGHLDNETYCTCLGHLQYLVVRPACQGNLSDGNTSLFGVFVYLMGVLTFWLMSKVLITD